MTTAVPEVPTALVPFALASRPMRRFSARQTVSNNGAGTSFMPIPLPATGMVRKVSLWFTYTGTCASAGAVVAGDGPWNLISGISLSDATGQPIFQPISGYNLYLVNKYLPTGIENQGRNLPFNSPQLGPDYAFSATATSFTAEFRLDLEFEIDALTGYGCIPNLDANASLQLNIQVAPHTVAFTGTTVSAANLSVVVDQHYWAPVQGGIGVSLETLPPGFGDYVEWRYETATVSAATENTVPIGSKGGLIKGIIMVSRNAGARTAFATASNVGLVYDNTGIDEGIALPSFLDQMRRQTGYFGAELSTSYAPLSAGVVPGLDRGVLVWDFNSLSEGRGQWLNTKPGTLLQAKVTPGASATSLEIVTGLGQIRFPEAFYRS